MELCFASSSQRTNEQCREPPAARSYWTHTRGLHGDLAAWGSATAGATCFLGSRSVPAHTLSPASTAVSHGVTFPHGHPGPHPNIPSVPLPYTTGIPALSTSTLWGSSLSSFSQKPRGLSGSVWHPLSAAAKKMNRELLVPRPGAENER